MRVAHLILPAVLALVTPLGWAQSYIGSDTAFGARLTRNTPQTSSAAGSTYTFDPAWSGELFLTRSLSGTTFAELTLASRTRHRVTEHYINQKTKLPEENTNAVITILPISATLNYKFWHRYNFDTYIGAGMHLALISVQDGSPNAAERWVALETDHAGLALQIGVDYTTDWGIKLNFNFRKAQQTTYVGFNDNSGYSARIRMDPYVFGMGLKASF
jgi:outer membrane protein W